MMQGQAPGMMQGQMPGTMQGMGPGMMSGPYATSGSFSPGWASWSPAGTTYGWGGYVPSWASWGAGGATYGLGGFADDEQIKEMVYNSIDADPSIPANADINVEVDGGVVTLTGTVPSKRTKQAVGDAAWWIPDVIDVNNQMKVQPRKERKRQQQTAQARQR